MAHNEHLTTTPEKQLDERQLSHEAKAAHERIAEKIENRAEKSPEQDVETKSHEAYEAAKKNEKSQQTHERSHEAAPKTVTESPQAARKRSFNKEMQQVQANLSPASRAFSKLIHNPVVEKVSDAIGTTVARPNAILSGAVFAFILTLAVYLVARYFGYPLSGSESIVAFALGWVIGCMYDFLRVMITGKKA